MYLQKYFNSPARKNILTLLNFVRSKQSEKPQTYCLNSLQKKYIPLGVSKAFKHNHLRTHTKEDMCIWYFGGIPIEIKHKFEIYQKRMKLVLGVTAVFEFMECVPSELILEQSEQMIIQRLFSLKEFEMVMEFNFLSNSGSQYFIMNNLQLSSVYLMCKSIYQD